MTFEEWVEKHGIKSARSAFGVSKHLVLIVRPGHTVTGQCGSWIGSEPLGDTVRNPDVETACQHLRDSLHHCFETEEITYDA